MDTQVLTKQCTSCDQWKSLDEFYNSKAGKYGKDSKCKTCSTKAHREWCRQNKDKQAALDKKYRETHAEKVKARKRKYYEENREAILEKDKEYRASVIEHARARDREYYWKNRDKKRAYNREWHQHNREHLQRYRRQRWALNRAILIEKTHQWQKENPQKAAEISRRHHSHEVTAPGHYTQAQIDARCELYGWCCAYCGIQLTEETFTIDHRIPPSRGGTNWPANLVPCCRDCNRQKRDRTPQEYKTYLEVISN